jgi:hypothetical protein
VPQPPAAAAPARLVLTSVTVTDPEGRRVSGLTQENFHVTEDGVEQQVSYFNTDGAPASLGVVSFNPDGVSVAMQGELVQLRQIAPVRIEFIEAADPSMSVDNAATAAIARMKQAPKNTIKWVLLFDVPSAKREITRYDEGEAKVIAAPPGTTPQSIASFLQYDYYVLGYTPTNTSIDEKYRQIKVSLSRVQGLPPLNVSSRTGYFTENPRACTPQPGLPADATCY